MVQAEERKAVQTQIMDDKHTKCGTTLCNNDSTLMVDIYLQLISWSGGILDSDWLQGVH